MFVALWWGFASFWSGLYGTGVTYPVVAVARIDVGGGVVMLYFALQRIVIFGAVGYRILWLFFLPIVCWV